MKHEKDWKSMFYKNRVKYEEANRHIERLYSKIALLEKDNSVLRTEVSSIASILNNVNKLLELKVAEYIRVNDEKRR